MGILDPKTRIIDTLLTHEGRRQISNGLIDISYVTFSDAASFYEQAADGNPTDVTERLTFEIASLPQDSITLKANDSGRIGSFRNENGVLVIDGKLYQQTAVITGSMIDDIELITGTQFASLSDTLLQSSIDNYSKLYSLGSLNAVYDDTVFELDKTEVGYTITNENYLAPADQTANITMLPSFFEDENLLEIDNFQYLPPVQKFDESSIPVSDSKQIVETSKLVGNYASWHMKTKRSYAQIKEELDSMREKGFEQIVEFKSSTDMNRIFIQAYEASGHNELTKLDMVKLDSVNTNDKNFPIKKISYLGRVFVDDNQNYTFVKLFTMVLE